ncbi:MAG: hypothetical protein WDO18_13745 [Acidobacteriota bacterium]
MESAGLGVDAFRFPRIFLVVIEAILAVFALFLFQALLAFFAFLAAVTHNLILNGPAPFEGACVPAC